MSTEVINTKTIRIGYTVYCCYCCSPVRMSTVYEYYEDRYGEDFYYCTCPAAMAEIEMQLKIQDLQHEYKSRLIVDYEQIKTMQYEHEVQKLQEKFGIKEGK